MKNLQLVIIIIIIIIIHFFRRVFSECTEAVATSLIPHSYHSPEIFAFMIGFSFTVWTKKSAKKVRKQVRGYLQVSIGSYSPEVRTFDTLITSTKVFSLLICKTLCQNDPLPKILDSVPRDFTILYLEIVDSIHNNRSLIQV